jgi:hypothetical protein
MVHFRTAEATTVGNDGAAAAAAVHRLHAASASIQNMVGHAVLT